MVVVQHRTATANAERRRIAHGTLTWSTNVNNHRVLFGPLCACCRATCHDASHNVVTIGPIPDPHPTSSESPPWPSPAVARRRGDMLVAAVGVGNDTPRWNRQVHCGYNACVSLATTANCEVRTDGSPTLHPPEFQSLFLILECGEKDRFECLISCSCFLDIRGLRPCQVRQDAC